MKKISRAIREIQLMDTLANENRWVNRIHPLVKLWVTFLYIGITVSFPKYNLSGLLAMAVYPVIMFITGEFSFLNGVRRLAAVLPLVCIAGVFNPFFDRETAFRIGTVAISYGMVSMVNLMMKGVFTVFAGYLLIASTTIEKICGALRRMHLPKIFVTQVLLIYRYISVLLSEAGRITDAYSLRAPGQRGIYFRVWGSLTGQLLLGSMDRAGRVYESMCLRGYQGEFYYGSNPKMRWQDLCYLAVWVAVFLTVRFLFSFETIGNLVI